MRLTLIRPYFCPHPGFFIQIMAADTVVLLDSVQFPRGTTWVSRNRFKNDQGALWMTVPVRKKGLGLQPIHQVQICTGGNWQRKHLRSLQHAYRHAPYFPEHAGFFANLFGAVPERLIDLNMTLLTHAFSTIGVGTQVLRLSRLQAFGSGTQLIIDICRSLGTDQLVVQRQALKALHPELLAATGIELHGIHIPQPVYPQLWGPFIANLSIYDMIFNCGPRAADILAEMTKEAMASATRIPPG